MYRNFFRLGFPEIERNILEGLNSRLLKLFEDEFSALKRGFSGVFPAVNIYESDKDYVIEAELPGMEKEDIDIQVAGNRITIGGELKENQMENVSYHRKERGYGKFSRTFTLPDDVDTDSVSAEFVNGCLRVTIGKSEKAQPRKIEIKTE
jgi:HSP20 family protein